MLTFESLIAHKDKVAVVGLGYVGLPLAVHLSRHFSVTGFDLKADRITELKSGRDRTLEVSEGELEAAKITYSSDPKVLSACRLVIIAVPTPIDEYRIPDLNPLRRASEITGRHMAKGTCIVYESTVYPGVTEEVCLPILAAESGLAFGTDFTVGYSPERINPGDKAHTLDRIKKVVSGSDPATLRLLEQVYGRVVPAGIHSASSIRVAEAAKVIENTQRDLNIALMNELAMIFDKMGIDTTEVLEAAATKWNFLPFKPGLVGGHCIGVDPYYLTFKAESLGYHPEMILAGRRINDNMGKYVAQRAVKLLFNSNKHVRGAKIAVLGITFKEDVPDLRNTKVVDLVRELEEYGIEVRVHDPLADADEARHYYGLELSEMDRLSGVDAVVVAVMHTFYKKMGLSKIAGLCAGRMPVIIDLKSLFSPEEARKQNITYWRL
ncbi:MAG: nucleotide sugar dehydrogenase [Thermodesulfobacteriota bacterium]